MKKFIYEDFETKYANTEFKKIPGKSPELIFLNKNGEELERLDISRMTRDQLIKLVEAKGLAMKAAVHDEP